MAAPKPEERAGPPGTGFTGPKKLPLGRPLWTTATWAWDTIGTGPEYPMTLRVARGRLPGRDKAGDEAGDRRLNLATGLLAREFRAKWLVGAYGRRWDQEVAFKHLKKVVGLENPKARQPERAGTEARDLTTRPRRHDWDNGTGVIAPETT